MGQFIRISSIGLFSIVFFASCVLEDKRPEDGPAMAGPDVKATYESGADTRTVLETNEEGKGSQYWLPEEQISVFFNGKPALYTSTNKENASEAVFSTTDMLEYADIHSGNIWGLYPSDDTAECDGSSVTTSIPDSQKALPGTFDTKLFLLLAHSSTTDLSFYNVCGGIKFSLTRDNIYKIVLKGNSGENLAGRVKLSFPSSGRPQAEVLEGKTTITLTPKNSGTFKKDQNYYLICLPVTFSQGFEMTFYSTDGKMATYKRQDPVTIKRAVFSRKASIDQYVSGWEDNPDMTGGKRSGLYLGITGFNQALYNYPISRLNEVTISDYYSFVNGIQMKNGSLLCYSVDQSINRLQEAIFPDDLCAVALVTFTDGLDQGSVMMNPAFSSDEEYLDSIHSRIVNEKVAGHSILAYSVGLKGMDVSDVNKFRYNLQQLASESGNAFEVNDMSEVNSRLQQIAQNVTDISNIYDIAMTIPGQSNGTRVRFTFDRVSDAANSSTYIEGTFRLSDYSLRDVSYHGLTSFSGSTITGTVNGIFITYSFQGIQKDTGGTINKSDIAQWSYIASTGRWQKNSEFDASQDADVVVKKQSVAVMLVLDCSSSLGSQYSTMQSHARSFIKTLQEASYDPYAVSSVKLNNTSLSLYIGDTRQLSATITPSSAKDKTVTWVSFNPSAVQVDQTGLVTALDVGESDVVVTTTDGGYTAACKVTVYRTDPPNAVDLGLSVIWASFNLGASKPEDYGDYYAWGEIEPYYSSLDPLTWKDGKESGYNWASYKWCNGTNTSLTKYNTNSSYGTVDNKTVLDPEDDAAHVQWGGSWRMPTDSEWTELRNNCTWTWTSNYNGTGVAGRIVTSKVEGHKDKSIFLPAAGGRYDASLSNAGSDGDYWSSSLYTDRPYYAWYVYFYSGNVRGDDYSRYRGLSVRPVYCEDPAAGVTGITLDKSSASLYVGESLNIHTMVSLNTGAVNKDVEWSSSNTAVATVDYTGKVMAISAGNATITARTVFGGFTATCTITVPEKWVDLGLSVKWASFNLGALKPEEYGDYYAWGETMPKEIYVWSTYKWCNGSVTTLTKYNTDASSGVVDNNTVLDLEDDAAHVQWGGKWRMPTDAEWTELRNNCTWEWTSINGVNGRKVTSKMAGYTDKWIFLPAAGYRTNTSLYNLGSLGEYWSSSLHSWMSHALRLFFHSNDFYEGGNYRCKGLSVRPVTE